MAAEFGAVVRQVLAEALPQIFAGDPPAVAVTLRDDGLELTPSDENHDVGPRAEARSERLPVDPLAPTGPYEVALRPATGAIVRLVADSAVVATLHDEEVVWDAGGLPRFSLVPLPHRDLDEVDEIEVRYAVTAVATRLQGTRTTALVLTGDKPLVDDARNLAVAVLAIDAPRLVADTRSVVERDGRSTTETLREVQILGLPPADELSEVRLRLLVDLELRRALREDEGVPIRRVLTPGTQATGPVAVEPVIDA